MDPDHEQNGKDVPNRPSDRRYRSAGLLIMVLMLVFFGLTLFALSSVWPLFKVVPASTTLDIKQPHK